MRSGRAASGHGQHPAAEALRDGRTLQRGIGHRWYVMLIAQSSIMSLMTVLTILLVAKLAPVSSVLKKNDIILSIDGIKVTTLHRRYTRRS